MTRPRLHPQSWYELRQLVKLHGIEAIKQALDSMQKEPRMSRYIILVHVRPEGRPGAVFDPSTITVDAASDDQTALEVAKVVAEERGWEVDRASIIRKEPIQ